tara:strand:+ start:358 stop:525 length:168 start_codon:yes stop_codon:yes gene_type:complete
MFFDPAAGVSILLFVTGKSTSGFYTVCALIADVLLKILHQGQHGTAPLERVAALA